MKYGASTKNPGFFKVIMGRCLQDKKMKIPVSYVRDHRDLFLDDVKFIIPNGESWEIGLKKSENIFYFDRNWIEFVKRYAIGISYFLVFKFKKLSTFEVCIYKPSGREIDYPAIATTQKRREPGKRKQCEAEVAKDDDDFEANSGKAFRKNRQAIHANREFKKKMPCFRIEMRDYILNHNFVHLPSQYDSILIELPEYIKLQNSDGRQWHVKVIKQLRPICNRFKLGKGWAKFQKENNLEKGDICFMELVNKDVWNVSISKNKQ